MRHKNINLKTNCMKLIRKIVFLMICGSLMVSCNNSQTSAKANNTVSAAANFQKGITPTGNKADDKIAVANKAGKVVFLVAFDQTGKDKDKAMAVAKKASAKKSKTIEVIELNTADASNGTLVSKYRLAGAPMPLILVIDKNGIACEGLTLKDATPDALLKIIPSPKYAEIMKALNERKAVFVVAYKEKMIDKAKAIVNCNEAAKAMNNGAVVVQINIDSKEETTLLKDLNVNTMANEPVIYAINKSGQITQTFDVKANKAQLTAAANKVVSSGCGSGSGCGSSCGPKK